MWETIIIEPIVNGLLLAYKYLGQETILAVAVITLVTRLILTPLQLNQQKSMRNQQALKPKMDELQAKYKDDREKLAQEQMKLYREMGINPMSGCLPLVIQLPLMIGLYQGIIRVLASTPLQLLALPQHIYRFLPGLSALIPLKSQFLWLDLAIPDPFYVLPVLVFVTSFLNQKMMTPQSSGGGDPQAEAMSKQMLIMMPLMSAFFSATYASGLAVYFLISNLVGILQYLIFRRHYARPDDGDNKTAKPAKAKAKAT